MPTGVGRIEVWPDVSNCFRTVCWRKSMMNTFKYGQNFPEPFVGSKYFEKLPVAIRRVFAPISMSAAESSGVHM